MNLRFPANFEPADEGGYVITFPDVPEAITQAETLEDAYDKAAGALGVALESYAEFGKSTPAPSTAKPGQHLVAVPEWANAEPLTHAGGRAS